MQSHNNTHPTNSKSGSDNDVTDNSLIVSPASNSFNDDEYSAIHSMTQYNTSGLSAFNRPRGIEAWNATPLPINSLDDTIPIGDSSDVDSDADKLTHRVVPNNRKNYTTNAPSVSTQGVALSRILSATPIKRDIFSPTLPTNLSVSEIASSPLLLVRGYFFEVQLSLRNLNNFHTYCRTLLAILENSTNPNFTILPSIWSGFEDVFRKCIPSSSDTLITLRVYNELQPSFFCLVCHSSSTNASFHSTFSFPIHRSPIVRLVDSHFIHCA